MLNVRCFIRVCIPGCYVLAVFKIISPLDVGDCVVVAVACGKVNPQGKKRVLLTVTGGVIYYYFLFLSEMNVRSPCFLETIKVLRRDLPLGMCLHCKPGVLR